MKRRKPIFQSNVLLIRLGVVRFRCFKYACVRLVLWATFWAQLDAKSRRKNIHLHVNRWLVLKATYCVTSNYAPFEFVHLCH